MNGMTTKHIEAFWQDATADDVARVMAGETVEARFRDSEKGQWLESDHSLGGYDSTEEVCKWISSTGCPWRYCQVYREPSWYANKPDPGLGFRLLGKFPDEPKLATDEGWFPDDAKWCPVESDNGIQLEGYWYRRRIEPVEPKHYVLRVGDSVETPSGHRIEIVSRGETQRTYALTAGGKVTLPNGQTITITAKGYEVTQ
jgi:hypothetical protein